MAEIELKLAVPAGALTRVAGRLRALGTPQVTQIDTTYFDTPERLLGQQGMALRLRRLGRQWVQTLKSGDVMAALSARGEWEVPATARTLELQRFPPAARRALAAAGLKGAAAQDLRPWFRTRFRRTAWLVEHAGAQVEVALDEGELVAGRRRASICELELELKGGPASALLSLALQVVAPKRGAPLPLVPLPESKAARGARLAMAAGPVVAKAQARRINAGLAASTRADVALRRVLGNGLGVLLANAAGIATSDEPEFIHQARVALRRMRSAVRLLGKEADLPEDLVLEMHWIAAALGPARDADVLVNDTLPPLLAPLPPELQDAATALRGAARARQDAARAAARAALQTARFAVFALRLMQWCESASAGRGPRLGALAPRRLARAQQRLLRSAHFFCALDPAGRHRVRILAKRLRYAVDLFACALPARRAAAYADDIAQLQDGLGQLNDAVMALQVLPQLSAAPTLIDALGRVLHMQHGSAEALVAAERQLAALAHDAPWRKT